MCLKTTLMLIALISTVIPKAFSQEQQSRKMEYQDLRGILNNFSEKEEKGTSPSSEKLSEIISDNIYLLGRVKILEQKIKMLEKEKLPWIMRVKGLYYCDNGICKDM